jgi:hypothetical protein
MGGVTIDELLAKIRQNLHLSKEKEYEVLEEIRTHLEEAMADARERGEDEFSALLKSAEKFGIDEASVELQQVHSDWESVEAILACALPIVFALTLRWLVFAPGGSAVDWIQLSVWTSSVAIVALVIPFALFRRWRLALIGWGFFWLLSIIFVVFPSIDRW